MEFTIGFIIGCVVMIYLARKVQEQVLEDIQKLKDFEEWKEWKNK
jgi:hypothetical protein